MTTQRNFYFFFIEITVVEHEDILKEYRIFIHPKFGVYGCKNREIENKKEKGKII